MTTRWCCANTLTLRSTPTLTGAQLQTHPCPSRVSAAIGACNQKLMDDDDAMVLDDDQREAISQEISALEQEFGYWCKIYSGRLQEKKVGYHIYEPQSTLTLTLKTLSTRAGCRRRR